MALFDRFSSPFQDGDKGNVIGVVEPITLRRADGTEEESVLARVDTGEEWSQIDKKFATELGLYSTAKVLDRVVVAIEGRERLVEQIEVAFAIDADWQTSRWLIVDLADEKQLVVLGKTDLRGYLIRIPA